MADLRPLRHAVVLSIVVSSPPVEFAAVLAPVLLPWRAWFNLVYGGMGIQRINFIGSKKLRGQA